MIERANLLPSSDAQLSDKRSVSFLRVHCAIKGCDADLAGVRVDVLRLPELKDGRTRARQDSRLPWYAKFKQGIEVKEGNIVVVELANVGDKGILLPPGFKVARVETCD